MHVLGVLLLVTSSLHKVMPMEYRQVRAIVLEVVSVSQECPQVSLDIALVKVLQVLAVRPVDEIELVDLGELALGNDSQPLERL